MKNIELSVREIFRDEWDKYWPLVTQANILQSWEYGEAKNNTGYWKASRFILEDSRGTQVALAQILTLNIPFLGGIARLNRGPLSINNTLDYGEEEMNLSLLKALGKEALKRKWWVFFVAPEIEKEKVNNESINLLGFKSRKISAWGSERIILSNFEDENSLLTSLNGKWRNMLRKSQKSSLALKRYIGQEAPLELLKKNYEEIKLSKGFEGLSSDFLEQIVLIQGPQWKANVYTAKANSEYIQDKGTDKDLEGMLVSVTHGNTATYLVGYTNSSGRKNNANYLMLWQAILDAKEEGAEFFDLGGLNDNTPEGIARFKKGLQGKHYDLVGEYRKSLI